MSLRMDHVRLSSGHGTTPAMVVRQEKLRDWNGEESEGKWHRRIQKRRARPSMIC